MDLILVPSNVGTATIDDDHVVVDQQRRAAELAAQYNMRIAYEALAWGTLVNTYWHSWQLVHEANSCTCAPRRWVNSILFRNSQLFTRGLCHGARSRAVRHHGEATATQSTQGATEIRRVSWRWTHTFHPGVDQRPGIPALFAGGNLALDR